MTLNPEDFMRASGELFARCDTAWKKAKVYKEPLAAPVADFLLAGMAHLDALDMLALRHDAMLTMISMLLSVDMSGVDTSELGDIYRQLHERFLAGCAALKQECSGDTFAEPHAEEVLKTEAALFLTIVRGCNEPSLKTAGLIKACEEIVKDNLITDTKARAEAYVDIYSRLNAIYN